MRGEVASMMYNLTSVETLETFNSCTYRNIPIDAVHQQTKQNTMVVRKELWFKRRGYIKYVTNKCTAGKTRHPNLFLNPPSKLVYHCTAGTGKVHFSLVKPQILWNACFVELILTNPLNSTHPRWGTKQMTANANPTPTVPKYCLIAHKTTPTDQVIKGTCAYPLGYSLDSPAVSVQAQRDFWGLQPHIIPVSVRK